MCFTEHGIVRLDWSESCNLQISPTAGRLVYKDQRSIQEIEADRCKYMLLCLLRGRLKYYCVIRYIQYMTMDWSGHRVRLKFWHQFPLSMWDIHGRQSS